jgi:hypothetical protein
MGKPAARKTTATSRSYRGRGHLGARDVGFFWLHAQIDVRRSLADRAGQASSGARQANPEACRGAGGVGLGLGLSAIGLGAHPPGTRSRPNDHPGDGPPPLDG